MSSYELLHLSGHFAVVYCPRERSCQESEQRPGPRAGCCSCSPAVPWDGQRIRMRVPQLYCGQDGFIYPTECWSSLAIAREFSLQEFWVNTYSG